MGVLEFGIASRVQGTVQSGRVLVEPGLVVGASLAEETAAQLWGTDDFREAISIDHEVLALVKSLRKKY